MSWPVSVEEIYQISTSLMTSLSPLFPLLKLTAGSDVVIMCLICTLRNPLRKRKRKRRNNMGSIEYSSIIPSSLLPKDMDTCWPSNNNKLLLEKLIYNHIRQNLPTSGEYSVVLGQLSREKEEWQCISIHQGKVTASVYI